MPPETITPAELRALPEEHRKYIPAPFLEDAPPADTPAPAAPVENKAEAVATAPTVEQGEQGTDSSKATEADTNKGDSQATPAAPPSSEPALDLSAIPEAFRSQVALLPRETQKELNDSYLRRDRFNRGLQEAAEAKKQAEAAEADARKWQAVAKNPKAAKAALSVLEAEESGTAAPEDAEDDFDPLTATAAEWKAREKRIIERAYRAGADAATNTFREKFEAPKERATAAEQEFAALAEESGLPIGDAAAIAERAVAHYEKSGFLKKTDWTPSHVRALLPTWFELAKSARNKPETTNGTTPPLPKVAAPGRGAGVPAPAPLPKFMREGRTWPSTPEEMAEHAIYLANQSGVGGGRLTVSALEEAINGSHRGRG